MKGPSILRNHASWPVRRRQQQQPSGDDPIDSLLVRANIMCSTVYDMMTMPKYVFVRRKVRNNWNPLHDFLTGVAMVHLSSRSKFQGRPARCCSRLG
jgi:hypothetical protein